MPTSACAVLQEEIMIVVVEKAGGVPFFPIWQCWKEYSKVKQLLVLTPILSTAVKVHMDKRTLHLLT